MGVKHALTLGKCQELLLPSRRYAAVNLLPARLAIVAGILGAAGGWVRKASVTCA